MYTLNATFDAQVDQEETLAAVLEVLPAGSTASIKREPLVLNVTDLDKTHIGSTIRGNIGDRDEFGGVLEAAALTPDGRHLTVFVGGIAYELGIWDAVQVLPPVTVGEHTPDEDEETVDSFELLADDYESAVELAMRTEEAVEDNLRPFGWLTRPMVEQVMGRGSTPEEFDMIANATIGQVQGTVNTILGTLVARYVSLYNEIQEADNA